MITDVDANSDAAQKGIKAGDVILEEERRCFAARRRRSPCQDRSQEANKLRRKAVLMRIKSGERTTRFVAVQLRRAERSLRGWREAMREAVCIPAGAGRLASHFMSSAYARYRSRGTIGTGLDNGEAVTQPCACS